MQARKAAGTETLKENVNEEDPETKDASLPEARLVQQVNHRIPFQSAAVDVTAGSKR